MSEVNITGTIELDLSQIQGPPGPPGPVGGGSIWINAIDYGFRINEVEFDNTPIWNQMLEDKIENIYFPKGTFNFLTPPNPVNYGINISGHSMSGTALVRAYQPSDGRAFIKFQNRGSSNIKDVGIIAASGTRGGIGLQFKSLNRYTSPDFSTVKNVYISGVGGTGTWSIGASFNGLARAKVSPSGLRDFHIDNLYVFASSYLNLEFNTIHNFYVNCQIFPAGGSVHKISFNAYNEDPNTNIILMSPFNLGDIRLWATKAYKFIAPGYGKIDEYNSSGKQL